MAGNVVKQMPSITELKTREGVTVGGTPSWCQDPQPCDSFPARVRECAKCRNVPHLPAGESTFTEGSRSMWVYYPQGILRRPVANSDLVIGSPAEPNAFPAHECGGAIRTPDFLESSLYPGHALYQDSFLFCKFKKIGDSPALTDVYLETVVDACSGLAFAKIYSAKCDTNASDILETRVAPFFTRHGIPIERIITSAAEEYCGTAPLHPYESFLAASKIGHSCAGRSSQSHSSLGAQLFGVLQREFLAPALRDRYEYTIELLQHKLDHFMVAYNCTPPGTAAGTGERPPLRKFLELARSYSA